MCLALHTAVVSSRLLRPYLQYPGTLVPRSMCRNTPYLVNVYMSLPEKNHVYCRAYVVSV